MAQKRILAFLIGCFAVASVTVEGNCAPAKEPYRTAVYASGNEGYHTFRIPSLIVTKKGTLLAFCEGRKTSRSDHGDIDLVLKRSSDSGRTWSGLQIVYEEGGTETITIGNPCPVVDSATGTIWLTLCRDNKDVLVTSSKDDGKSWARPTDITADVKKSNWVWVATGPGVGVQMKRGKYGGRLVIPSDHAEQIGGKRVMFSHVFYSDDSGKSWQLGGSLDRHTDECQVVELANGSLMLNMRNYWGRSGSRPERGGKRAIAISKDGGANWSELSFDDTLVEPVCQASFLRYSDTDSGQRNLLLFSNPASKTSRHRLTVRLSDSEGRSWAAARVLHEGPSAYSCLAVLPDQSIGGLYEGGEEHPYERIIFARFGLDWLEGKKD